MSAVTTDEHLDSAEGRAEGMSMPLLGMVLFIASEVMFFGGLFAAYFNIRADADEWPPAGLEHLHAKLPAIFTVVLVLSSVTMHMGVMAIRRGNVRALVRWTAITLVLGLVFLAGQIYDYSTLEFTIRDGVYGSTFYTLTGFHGAHVFGGAIYLFIVLIRAMSGQFSKAHHAAVEGATMYWHFVDVVWIALFFTLYVLK
ncbi:MAG TPA: cytochrome c oxidase subunit 3 [Frankiaceae bacterium]|nr:cytochrome c oxidase subunit 3 [Frankiaceae bacterium]